MEEFTPLNRFSLLNTLRLKANARFPSKQALEGFFRGDVRSIRTDTQVNRISWDRMIQWLGRLGYTVEFRLVPKLAPSARRDPRTVGIDVAAEEPLRNGSEGTPLSS